ncbi:sporulation protein [Rhodanobacter sp. FW510-R12]|uniref:SPOR domain-containing protein n=1 Tax=unclassified Rhodanobacter TaxID=2621553 RepID=UPI0007A9BC27|nr:MULTISPECIES: SPOR domain-containing protein [unclassified Rhodanobacter]KZC15532.1 sporulation protein [Rhodanobacter sp. FW104-R8]KZC25969.1 sporulation protein [Rhodanobacter sp. FW510-T8]KZC29626.1 sporulation protein [Rhodanobacter sp. FW510-R10]
MAARKGRGRQAVRNGSNGFPGWGYAVIGLVAGAILMAVLMRGSLLTGLRKSDGPQANPQATAERGSAPGMLESGAGDNAPKKPQFDFYSVLSEKEVRIPDAEISAQARVEQQQKQQQAAQLQAQRAAPAAAPANAPATVTQDVTAAPASAMPQPATGSGYLLQVGAFPNAADAETLKAKLALQGFVANVQSVSIGGQTYNRVRLGPFRSATELESTKQRLAGAGINAIALKEGR